MSQDELSKKQLLEVQKIIRLEFDGVRKELDKINESNKQAFSKIHSRVDDSNTFMNQVNNKVTSIESKNVMLSSIFGSIAAVGMSYLLKR